MGGGASFQVRSRLTVSKATLLNVDEVDSHLGRAEASMRNFHVFLERGVETKAAAFELSSVSGCRGLVLRRASGTPDPSLHSFPGVPSVGGTASQTLEWYQLRVQRAEKDATAILLNNIMLHFSDQTKRDFILCYLSSCLPPYGHYQVTFEEWGRLGMTFDHTAAGNPMPIVIRVEEPALSLGVLLGSVLLEVNGVSVQEAGTDLLTFCSDMAFPKTMTLTRLDPVALATSSMSGGALLQTGRNDYKSWE